MRAGSRQLKPTLLASKSQPNRPFPRTLVDLESKVSSSVTTAPDLAHPSLVRQTTKYKIVQKAHVFLTKFHLYHRNALGAPQFLLQSKRMLLFSILDKVQMTQISDALDIVIQKNESASTGLSCKCTLWELCEACCISASLWLFISILSHYFPSLCRPNKA